MSKFIDKLTSLNKATIAPMGFGRPGVVEKPVSMLVIAEIGGKSEDDIQTLAGVGLVAGLVDSAGLTPAALAKLIKGKGDLIMGMVISNGKTTGQRTVNGDIDFIVFEPGLPLKSFEGRDLEQTGRIIKLELSVDVGLLRSVNNLYPGVDAVLVDLSTSPLTIEQMMLCRRVADFSGQPVIARVASVLSAVELTALRDAGVKCLLLGSDAGADDVKALITAIKALPKPSKKKSLQSNNILPLIPIGFGAGKEKEEEGDDDD